MTNDSAVTVSPPPELVPGPDGGLDILASMYKVMQAVEAIAKSDRNESQNFAFRGVDTVVNVVGPLFREHGVIPLPSTLMLRPDTFARSSGSLAHEILVVVRYSFVSVKDGSMLIASVPGESADAGDKATPKAMSVAYRTCLLQVLCVPTGDPDPDSETFDRGKASSGQPARRSGGSRRSGGRQQQPADGDGPPADNGNLSEERQKSMRTVLERVPKEHLETVLAAFRAEFGHQKVSDFPRSRYTEGMKWLNTHGNGQDGPPAGQEQPSQPDPAPGGGDEPFDRPDEPQPHPGQLPDDDPSHIRAAVAAMDRKDMQKELAQAGLPATGPDPDLIDRLTEHRTKHPTAPRG